MRLDYKQLPPHWSYLVTRRQVKTLAETDATDVRVVEFRGPAHKPSKLTAGLYTAGNLEARVVSTRWCYRLLFYALADSVIGSSLDELGGAILEDVRQFIAEREQERVDETVKPLKRIFFVRLVDGSLTPGFSTRKADSFSESVAQNNPWW